MTFSLVREFGFYSIENMNEDKAKICQSIYDNVFLFVFLQEAKVDCMASFVRNNYK